MVADVPLLLRMAQDVVRQRILNLTMCVALRLGAKAQSRI